MLRNDIYNILIKEHKSLVSTVPNNMSKNHKPNINCLCRTHLAFDIEFELKLN